MKKISILINKPQLEALVKELPMRVSGEWSHLNQLSFSCGYATVSIPYTEDSWRKGYIEIGGISTIKVVGKDYLKEEERKTVLINFYEEILLPYCQENGIKTVAEE